MTLNKNFAYHLKKLREKACLTKKDLSSHLDVSTSYLTLLESEKRNPSRQLVCKVGEHFFCDNLELQDQLLISAGFVPQNYKPFLEEESLVDIYRNALEEQPSHFKSYLNLVLILIRSGEHIEAKEYIDKGMSIFDAQSALQSLMATYELSQSHYETAIEYQESALKYYDLETNKEGLSCDLTELLLSLGVMCFLKGFDHIDQYIELEDVNPSEALKQKSLGQDSLLKAKQQYQKALAISPDDIYILDELARVNFNLAYIEPNEKQLWLDSIQVFENVIRSQNKDALGHKHMKETNIYLAHAYTKSKQFNKADFVLGVLESCSYDFGLVHYARACYFNALYKDQVSDDLFLEQALFSLKKGLKCSQGDHLVKDALVDPDLSVLRAHRKTEFEALTNASAVEVKL